MLKKIKWLRLIGLVYTIAVAVFLIVWSDINFYKPRIQPYLFDFGVDCIGSLICIALFYGCLRQEGEGTRIFRLLIVMVSSSFLINEVTLFITGLSELRALYFTVCVINRILDLAIIVDLYYYYIKKLLGIEGKIVKITDIVVPVLASIALIIILINIFYPLTFVISEQAVFKYTSLSIIEDIIADIIFLISIVLIIMSHCPWNQKIPALLFVIFPGVGYFFVGGEYANGAQYGFILMSLIVMYCVIFNDKNKKIMATEKELNMASGIQLGALPSVFPPFPDRHEFDIYASMTPAKEVGGDFYDFFMIDDDRLAIVIADVSGKGIPAALFMMTAKTVIKDHAMICSDTGEILTLANKRLCEGNKKMMFATAWIGIFDFKKMTLQYTNAGHNYPLLYKKSGLECLKKVDGTMLGIMKGMKYKSNTINIESGDRVLLYTDGVTEAHNRENALYGDDRLIKVFTENINNGEEETIDAIRNDIVAFSNGAAQFDDITMMAVTIK